MEIKDFTLDANFSSVTSVNKRLDDNGNEIVKITFSNGFVWIYTETIDGYKRMDFSHELNLQSNGAYLPDMSSPKTDFNDYF